RIEIEAEALGILYKTFVGSGGFRAGRDAPAMPVTLPGREVMGAILRRRHICLCCTELDNPGGVSEVFILHIQAVQCSAGKGGRKGVERAGICTQLDISGDRS